MTKKPQVEILIGLFLDFVVAELGLTPVFQRVFGTLVGRELSWWILVAAMLSYVRVAERRPLSSIGFRTPTGKGLLWGVGGGLALFLGAVVPYGAVFPALGLHVNAKAAAGIIQTPLAYRLALVLRAAVAEEIPYRGYPIERTDELTGSRAAAAVISWAAFTYAHLGYWGGRSFSWQDLAPCSHRDVSLALRFAVKHAGTLHRRRIRFPGGAGHWVRRAGCTLLHHACFYRTATNLSQYRFECHSVMPIQGESW